MVPYRRFLRNAQSSIPTTSNGSVGIAVRRRTTRSKVSLLTGSMSRLAKLAINGLRALGQRLEFGAAVVAAHSSSNRASLDTPHLRRWLVGAHSSAIGRPEFRGVKRRGQSKLWPARPTQIDARLPVPIEIFVYVF